VSFWGRASLHLQWLTGFFYCRLKYTSYFYHSNLKKNKNPDMCRAGACCSSGSRLQWRGLLVIATWALEQREAVDLEMVQNEICTMIAKLFNWRARATRTLRLPPALSLCISQRVIVFGVSVELQMAQLDEEDGWRLIGWSRLTIERANPT